MVGSAKGRSISTSTMRWPGKLSRTSTHAINVPMTTLIAATPSDASTVSLIVDHASGVVTSDQNADHPSSRDRQTTAPSGISTSTLRYSVAIPNPSPVPSRRRTPAVSTRDRGATGETGARISLVNRDPDAALDVDHDAAVGVEELRHHVRPAPEIRDGEQP